MQEGPTEPLPLCAIAIRGIVAAAFIAGLTLIVMAPLLLIDAQLMAGWGAIKQRVTARSGTRAQKLETTHEQQVEQQVEQQRQQQRDAE